MAIAWLFDNERTEAADAVLKRVSRDGAIVPSLFRLEIGNMLRNAERRGRCDEIYVAHSLGRLSRLAITIDKETDSHAWVGPMALARQHDLALVSAAYSNWHCGSAGPSPPAMQRWSERRRDATSKVLSA